MVWKTKIKGKEPWHLEPTRYLVKFSSLAKTCYKVLRNTVFVNGKKNLKVDIYDNATTWNKVTWGQACQTTIMNRCVKLRQNYLT